MKNTNSTFANSDHTKWNTLEIIWKIPIENVMECPVLPPFRASRLLLLQPLPGEGAASPRKGILPRASCIQMPRPEGAMPPCLREELLCGAFPAWACCGICKAFGAALHPHSVPLSAQSLPPSVDLSACLFTAPASHSPSWGNPHVGNNKRVSQRS